ncbi:MAG: homocysteine S-methyltransferase family protein [Gemmataceae bacterium]|nr:homocysteine S-methyltransferase family protein [Gemmataceae bacterium]
MPDLLAALRSGRVLLMDGAMGTELQRAGLLDGENASAWNQLHPERVRAVHEAYRAAGAEALVSNTFMANAASLIDAYQAADRLPVVCHEVWTADYKLMAPPDAPIFRLADHGPVAGQIAAREFDQLAWFYTSSFAYEGADGVLVETCSSPRVRYPLRLVRRSWAGPLLLSLTYHRNDRGELVTFSGHAPEWFAGRATAYGIDALGVNCGREIGMAEVIEIVRRYRAETDLPLFARPNAGTPTRTAEGWTYPHTPEQMAARLPELLEAGVSMVGGCCGTTPAHIRAFAAVVAEWNARHRLVGP